MERRDDTEMSERGSAPNDAVRDLLPSARRFVNEGKPSQALQAVLMAIQATGGNEAVVQSLHRAREMYRSRLQENAAVDQLASLFAECVIAEAQSSKAESTLATMSEPSAATVGHENSILAETGRMQIVLDAFADGSSFICLQCGGLVSIHRKDEHYAYWCGRD